MASYPSGKDKNPSLSAFLAMIPGMGALYNGNLLKAITYVLVFIVLIVLTSNSQEPDVIVFALMLAGFYVYQIIDSFNEANRIRKGGNGIAAGTVPADDLSLFSAIAILVIGILFQLVNFGLLTFRQVTRLWPLALIAFGIKIVFNHFKREGADNGKH